MRWLRALACGALTVLVLLSGAGPTSAAEDINIDFVEVSADGEQLSILLGVPQTASVDLDSIRVDLDGTPVTSESAPVMTGDIQRSVVLALDASKSMARQEKFEAAKAAAYAFVGAAPDDVKIGLLTFSDTIDVIAAPSTDHLALTSALDGLSLTLGTRVYDAVQQAVDLTGSTGARSVLLLSDGKDEGKGAPIERAIEFALANEVVVDVVALDQEPAQSALMSQISEATGGDVIASDPDSLAAVFQAQAEALAMQVLVTIDRPDDDREEGDLTVRLVADGTTYFDTALVQLPARPVGALPVEPAGTLFGAAFLWAGAAALSLGLAGGAWLLMTSQRGPSLAQRQIDHYSRAANGPLQSTVVTGSPASEAPRPRLRERVVSFTGRLVRGRIESRVAVQLASAGLSLTSAEWLLLHAAVALLGGLVGLIVSGSALMLLMLLFGLALPWAYLKRRARRRLAAFHSQLAETLQLIAGGLSAGLSPSQSVETVVREGSEPMAGELRRVLAEQRLGIDITDAMQGVAERMQSQDFAWVVMAIRIQREVGGNLAELLTTVSETLRERDYLRRQVGVLSAEGRISAWILGALPIVMFTYVAAVRPDFIRPLLTEPAGLLMLASGIGLLLAGVWTLSRMVRVEV